MKIYAVDFDGLLCEDAWPEIGRPHMDTMNFGRSAFWSRSEAEKERAMYDY